MDQVTARINFIEVALGSFVGNPNEIDRQNALLSELDSFDANLKKQLKGYVGMTKDKLEQQLDKLEQQLHELQKEKNLLQEEKNKQLGLSLRAVCQAFVDQKGTQQKGGPVPPEWLSYVAENKFDKVDESVKGLEPKLASLNLDHTKGSFVENSGTESAPSYEYYRLRDDLLFLGNCSKLIVRPSFLEIKNKLFAHAAVKNRQSIPYAMIDGKAGVGKSVFLVWLLIDLITSEPDSKIIYVTRNGTPWLLQASKRPEPTQIIDCDYLLTDNEDIRLSPEKCKLVVAASSDPMCLSEVKKRAQEDMKRGLFIHIMEAFTFQDCIQLFVRTEDLTLGNLFPTVLLDPSDNLRLDDLQFRFDVVGGNPLLLSDCFPSTRTTDHSTTINECLQLFFPDKEKSFDWAHDCILSLIDPKYKNDLRFARALFLQDIMKKGKGKGGKDIWERTWASTFIGVLANALEDSTETELKKKIEELFGKSGFGNAVEYTFHRLMLSSRLRNCHGLRENGATVELPPFTDLHKLLIRSKTDLSYLSQNKTYLLPTIVNFPVIDSALRIDQNIYLFQSTIGDDHDIVDSWDEMYNNYFTREGVDVIYFIWVLTKENFERFKFHSLLDKYKKVVQLKVLNENCTVESFSKLLKVNRIEYFDIREKQFNLYLGENRRSRQRQCSE
jgi:hypothetical protein